MLFAQKHLVVEDAEVEPICQTWLWRGEGCVVSALVQKGIIDVHSIQHYPFEFIKKLALVAEKSF